MATDPFVSETVEDAPRQDQNMPIGVSMPPARSWKPNRPGDLGPAQPQGRLLGMPGPNIGYASLLVARAANRFHLSELEHLEDAMAVVAEVAMRRATLFGRAPTQADVDVAMGLFDYDEESDPTHIAWRVHNLTGAAHDYVKRRRIVEAVPEAQLRLTPEEISLDRVEQREKLRAGKIHFG